MKKVERHTSIKKKKKQQEVDLRFSEKDAIDMLEHFDNVYMQFKRRNRDHDESASEASEDDSNDDGLENDIVEMLNKELDVFYNDKLHSQPQKKKKINPIQMAQKNLISNHISGRRLNEMSIFISKKNKQKSKKVESMKEQKLSNIFYTLFTKKEK